MNGSTHSFTPAEQAVMHLVRRLAEDPRLAYLIGPGSESFELLVTAAAGLVGDEPDVYREGLLGKVAPQPVPGIGRVAAVIDADLWDGIIGANDRTFDESQQASVDYLVNHFARLGLRAHETEVDQKTEELF